MIFQTALSEHQIKASVLIMVTLMLCSPLRLKSRNNYTPRFCYWNSKQWIMLQGEWRENVLSNNNWSGESRHKKTKINYQKHSNILTWVGHWTRTSPLAFEDKNWIIKFQNFFNDKLFLPCKIWDVAMVGKLKVIWL